MKQAEDIAMKRYIILLALIAASGTALACPETLNFNKRVLAGDEEVNLCEKYAGNVILVVNTASKCAYTPQYDGLETLYNNYKDQGLVVVIKRLQSIILRSVGAL